MWWGRGLVLKQRERGCGCAHCPGRPASSPGTRSAGLREDGGELGGDEASGGQDAAAPRCGCPSPGRSVPPRAPIARHVLTRRAGGERLSFSGVGSPVLVQTLLAEDLSRVSHKDTRKALWALSHCQSPRPFWKGPGSSAHEQACPSPGARPSWAAVRFQRGHVPGPLREDISSWKQRSLVGSDQTHLPSGARICPCPSFLSPDLPPPTFPSPPLRPFPPPSPPPPPPRPSSVPQTFPSPAPPQRPW